MILLFNPFSCLCLSNVRNLCSLEDIFCVLEFSVTSILPELAHILFRFQLKPCIRVLDFLCGFDSAINKMNKDLTKVQFKKKYKCLFNFLLWFLIQFCYFCTDTNSMKTISLIRVLVLFLLNLKGTRKNINSKMIIKFI